MAEDNLDWHVHSFQSDRANEEEAQADLDKALREPSIGNAATVSSSDQILFKPLIILSLGWVMIYADRLSISPLMSLIRSEFNLSFASDALVMTIYFATYTAVAIPIAVLAMRIGYKRTMVVFFWVTAASLALAGLFGYSYSLILLFIAIHGLGAGTFYPTAFEISTQLSSKQKRGISSAIITTGMGFGSILGLIVAGPILNFIPNWQGVLLLLSLPTVIVALLLMKFIPITQRHRGTVVNLSEFKQLLSNRNYVIITVAMFCAVYGYWVILTWAPSFLQETKHLSIFYSGLATAVFAAFAIPSTLFMGRYSDRVGRRKVSLILLPLSALTIFLMAFTSNLFVFIAAIAAYGLVGKLAFDPVAVAWIGDIIKPESVGISLAVFSSLAMIASIFAPVVTGLLADLTGTLAVGFYFGAFMILLGSIMLLFSRSGK